LTTYTLTTRDYTLQITDTQISVLSLLQSPPAISWKTDFNIRTLPVSLNFTLQLSHIESLLFTAGLSTENSSNYLAAISHHPPSLLFKDSLPTAHLPQTVLVITCRHGSREDTSVLVLSKFLPQISSAPLPSNGRSAGHRKHRSFVVVPLLRSCPLRQELVYRAAA
jgi:hypothetical protein